jgi:hypothetical protein
MGGMSPSDYIRFGKSCPPPNPACPPGVYGLQSGDGQGRFFGQLAAARCALAAESNMEKA